LTLLQALLQTVLPVFLLAAAGVAARRVLEIDPKHVARTAIYLFVPALAFDGIYRAALDGGEVAKIVLFMVAVTLAMVSVTYVTGRLFGWTLREIFGISLGTAFSNVANYGLPVVYFAFGQAGLDRAMLTVVCSGFLMYTLGVFLAARGRLDLRASAGAIFRLPLIWAVVAAIAVRAAGVAVPEPLYKAVHLLSQGAIPLVVILLGMQVAGISLQGARLKIGLAVLLRLAIAPLIGMAVVALLRPDPLTARILVLQSAMPSAVNTLLLAVEFDAEAEVVSGIMLATTVLSLATVTFWVWYLQ
jgi:malate permease and related proteins